MPKKGLLTSAEERALNKSKANTDDKFAELQTTKNRTTD